MAKQNPNAGKNIHDLKPGSSTEDAAKVGGRGDFGVPTGDRTEREYTSENTRRADYGHAPAAASEERGGTRQAGAGGNDSGPGSSSAGDLDTTISGVGTGAQLAQNITKEHVDGADDAQQFGTPDRAERAKMTVEPSEGHVAFAADDKSLAPEGADSAGRESIEEDSSFVGEVSMAEANGDDDAGR